MVRRLMFVGVCLAAIALPLPSRSARAQTLAGEPEMRVSTLTDKLGVKPSPDAPRELELGRTITCTLNDPDKLAKAGVKGMHEGARVTITRVAPDKIRVEADEIDTNARGGATLRVANDGSLTPVSSAKPPGATSGTGS